MARANENDGVLRNCPVCETPVAETVNLGLRDYRWVDEALPGRIGLMDFDAVLSQYSTGRMLVLEFKPKGALISIGSRITFKALVEAGYDVAVLWELDKTHVRMGFCNDTGRPQGIKEMTKNRAAKLVRAWWDAGVS